MVNLEGVTNTLRYPETNYDYSDGIEDHGCLLDFKDYNWKQAKDIDIIRFSKTLDCPERGIPMDECPAFLTALRSVTYPEDREMTAVETGMFYGTSTRMLIAWTLKNGGKVYSAEVSVVDNFKNLMEESGYWKYTNVIGNSMTCEWDNPIDFLFIDSGHSYGLCFGEYEKFSKFLVSGSVVGFHDTMTNQDKPELPLGGVRTAIEHIKEIDTLELIVSTEVSNGIEFYRFVRKGKQNADCN